MITVLFGLLSLLVLVTAAPLDERRASPIDIVRHCRNPKQIAWTFDDGPFRYEKKIGADFNGGKGTFFLNGNHRDCIYNHADTIRAMHAEGHVFAPHTWDHPDLRYLNEEQVHHQLERIEEAFLRILGVKPLYFRPPYGMYTDTVLNVLRDRGYRKMILWTNYTEDANEGTVETQSNVLQGMLDDPATPHLLLAHSVIDSTANIIVPKYVPLLQEQGFELVGMDACIGGEYESPYEFIKVPEEPNESWHC